MRLVVEPVALVDVAVRVDEAAASVRLVVLPVALVAGAVDPLLHAAPVALVRLEAPLAVVDGSVFHDDLGAPLALDLVVGRFPVVELAEALGDALDGRVVVVGVLESGLGFGGAVPVHVDANFINSADCDGAADGALDLEDVFFLSLIHI